MTEVIEKPKTKGPGSGLDDGWRVIVLNDDHNTFEGVSRTLARYIPGIDYEKGMQIAGKIHNEGAAVVFRGMKEHAEMYHMQLESAGLTMAPLEN